MSFLKNKSIPVLNFLEISAAVTDRDTYFQIYGITYSTFDKKVMYVYFVADTMGSLPRMSVVNGPRRAVPTAPLTKHLEQLQGSSNTALVYEGE